ncbi:uncharacterized protein [Malus domestica]|uniref:uncharacterized protein n=1 Tax=Malus domestica TaxID=3750 RepID=UPI003974E388
MNLDDLDAQSQVPSRPNRFVPRSSKAKPKPKSEPVAKQEPVPKPDPEKPELKPTRVELDALTVKKKDEEESAPPWWRPYDLDSRCEEVRLNPATSEMEIDLSLDRDPKNFDEDCASRLKMTKQTVSTTWKPPGTSGYAVGVLMGNKAISYLKIASNKVTLESCSCSFVQLRPSLDHLNSSGSKRKNSVKGDAEVTVKLKTLDKKNLWVHQRCRTSGWSLQLRIKLKTKRVGFHRSDFSARYLWKIVVQESSHIEFTMSPHDYVDSLCPKTCKGSSRRCGHLYIIYRSDFSARYLWKMVVQESSHIEFTMSPHDYVDSLCPKTCKGSSRRCGHLYIIYRSDFSARYLWKMVVQESSHIEFTMSPFFKKEPVACRFGDLKKYVAPDHTTEELLDVLQKHAQLLLSSGLWVPKTLLLYPNKDDKGLDINHIANKDHKDRQTARNYVLNLFRKNPVIRNSHLDLQEGIKIHVYDSLRILAVSRPSTQDWKFKEQPDMSFMELYPDIVKTQEQNWERMEEKLRLAVKSNTDCYLKSASMTTTPGKSLNSAKGTAEGASEVHTGGRTMSDETRAALQEAIKEATFS